MLTYPNMDPIALNIGPLAIHWYGILYLISFIAAFWLCERRRLGTVPPWSRDELIDLFFYAAVGVIFGGTWGYLLFYQPALLQEEPLRLIQFWLPGRSFHGGLLGVMVAILIYCQLKLRDFWAVSDFLVPVVPLGLAMGRLGNFINAELWGRTTDVPWGMVFPQAGALARHPSQLYEMGLEGILLFIILQGYARKRQPKGVLSGLFLMWYGIFRIVAECFREPDFNQGFIALEWITKGQILSLPMIMVGLFILFYAKYPRRIGN